MNNGNGNGAGLKKLDRLIEYHTRCADTLREAMALIVGDAKQRLQKRSAAVLSGAVDMERARKGKKKLGRPSNKPAASGANIVAVLSKDKPTKVETLKEKFGPHLPLGILIHHGYVKRNRAGDYLATGKPFEAQ